MAGSRQLFVVALLGACGRFGFEPNVTADAPPSGPLIAHFRMDDDPADGADDASEYHHDASCTTCPALLAARGGGVFQFDGASTYLEVPYTPAFAITSGVTAAAWINLAATHPETRCIVSKPVGDTINNSWQLCVGSTLQLVACVGYEGTPMNQACAYTAPATLQVGTWHHVAIAFDGATMRAWLDGVQVIEVPKVQGSDAHPVLIGADVDNGALIAFFDGLMDDVQVWNVALPEAEILALAAP